MAQTVARTVVPFGAITAHRTVAAVSNALAAFREWREARRTVTELRKLSPRQLDDIGLTPDDIERFATKLI